MPVAVLMMAVMVFVSGHGAFLLARGGSDSIGLTHQHAGGAPALQTFVPLNPCRTSAQASKPPGKRLFGGETKYFLWNAAQGLRPDGLLGGGQPVGPGHAAG